jgi:hypothetical protein
LRCLRSRHVENLKHIRCCIKQWDSATTSTIYTPIDSCMVINSCFVDYQGYFAPNSSRKSSGKTTASWSVSQTVPTIVLINQGGYPGQAAINWSWNVLRIPAIHCTVSWQLFISMWIYSHPNICGFLSLLFPILQMTFIFTSWVISMVAVWAASLWST